MRVVVYIFNLVGAKLMCQSNCDYRFEKTMWKIGGLRVFFKGMLVMD